VLVLFLYAFRRVASLLYAALPMALGLAMTFGVAALTYGQLSSASAGFAALLAGLGIDFITVLYGRYVDERNRGASMPQGLIVAIRTSMPGIFIAAITTAATFYAFLATDFRGMTQLGFLTGTGILFFLLCIAFLMPSLIVMGERDGSKRAPKLYLHSFGSDKLIVKAIAHPKPTIIIWSVFTIICAIAATRVRFSDNIQDLRSKENVGVINQEEVTRKFGQSFDFMMYVVKGKTMNEVVAKTHAAARDLQPLVQDGTISSYQSLSTFLPPNEQQQAVIDTLARGRATTFNFERISTAFRAALAANGFRADAYDSYLALFQQTLAPTEPLTLDSIKDENVRALMSRFVKPVDGGFMSVINVYPSGGKWPRDVPPKLLAVAERHPGDVLTGVNLVSGTLRRIVRADAIRSTVVGIVAVLLLMILSFRNAKRVLLSFVPFIAGVIGMVGVMAMLRLELNFMNIFVGLMIIGCATDYAVYMLQRYTEDPAAFPVTAAETGKAVVTAGLTTVVGYGSFALSHFPGLRSIGYASTFGIGLSSLAAITLLPAILVLGKRTNEQSHDTATDRR
jgi:predicted RND superfamily exporter protein